MLQEKQPEYHAEESECIRLKRGEHIFHGLKSQRRMVFMNDSPLLCTLRLRTQNSVIQQHAESIRLQSLLNLAVDTGRVRLRLSPQRANSVAIRFTLAFVLFVLGLSVWLNDLWLVVTLVPVVAIIAGIVIPREERFLGRNFPDQYSNYKASVRRWL
jgi:hypothetical protein